MKSKWHGEPPKSCDNCGNKLKGVFIDGRTKVGVWGILCEPCHKDIGVGLGVGKGQKYIMKVMKGEWIKVSKAK